MTAMGQLCHPAAVAQLAHPTGGIEIVNVSPDRIFTGERHAASARGVPARAARGSPLGDHGKPLTCGDSINSVDSPPAIADRSVSEDRDRPPWLARLS